MKQKLLWLITLLVLLAVCFPALGEEQAPSLTPNTEEIILAAGRRTQVKTAIEPYAYRKAGVKYSVSDPEIASTNKEGYVKGLREGECLLIITSRKDENLKVEIPVRVVTGVSKMTAKLETSGLRIGEQAQIQTTFSPENATLKYATFSSSKESVATVDENGVVTGVSKGQATITVRSADGAVKTTVNVTVRQQPTEVSITSQDIKLAAGRYTTLKYKVLPAAANNKKVDWTSSDETIATVNREGKVKAVGPGVAVITATCQDNPDVSASVEVSCIRLAASVSFDKKQYDVVLGGTLQLAPVVGPEDTTDKSVTFKSSAPKIATVDENGVVTALKGGKATISATTADGSKKSAKTTVRVVVPVTGVSFEHAGVRVGAGAYTYVSAIFEPKDATIMEASWSIADESIASVEGHGAKVKVRGKQWGRTELTVTTADGGYTDTIVINVGSLRRAVVVENLDLDDGRPYFVLRNRSNMYITGVTLEMYGTDEYGHDLDLSRRGERLTITYGGTLAPGQSTDFSEFLFHDAIDYDDLENVYLAVKAWETDTGYYDNQGVLNFSYQLSRSNIEWVNDQTAKYIQMQEELNKTPEPTELPQVTEAPEGLG